MRLVMLAYLQNYASNISTVYRSLNGFKTASSAVQYVWAPWPLHIKMFKHPGGRIKNAHTVSRNSEK